MRAEHRKLTRVYAQWPDAVARHRMEVGTRRVLSTVEAIADRVNEMPCETFADRKARAQAFCQQLADARETTLASPLARRV